MARENISKYGVVREFKNGNINIKCDPVEFSNDPLLAVSELLFWVDTEIVCEIQDVWNPSLLLYNCRLDRCYELFESFQDDLKAGKTVRIFARVPNEYDKAFLKENCIL